MTMCVLLRHYLICRNKDVFCQEIKIFDYEFIVLNNLLCLQQAYHNVHAEKNILYP